MSEIDGAGQVVWAVIARPLHQEQLAWAASVHTSREAAMVAAAKLETEMYVLTDVHETRLK